MLLISVFTTRAQWVLPALQLPALSFQRFLRFASGHTVTHIQTNEQTTVCLRGSAHPGIIISQNLVLAKFLIHPISVLIDSVAMWPLLHTLLLGATARPQQYDRLVLAISREIEPLQIQKREQTMDTLCWQVAYNVAVFMPTTHTAQRSKTLPVLWAYLSSCCCPYFL